MTNFYLKLHRRTGRDTFSLEVEYALTKGSFLGVLGPSGSGKTTLLRYLAGLEGPQEGFIIHEGKVWSHSREGLYLPTRQRPVGMVFQDYALFPHMTVEANLLYGKNDPQKARQLLEMVRLETKKNAYPGELSGGQKQRLSLIRALMREPELLLLDEPFSALDEELRDALGREIQSIQRETGITAILVTHSRREVEALCTEVLEMKDGKLDSRRHKH